MEEKRRTRRDVEEKGRGIERGKNKRGEAEARICARQIDGEEEREKEREKVLFHRMHGGERMRGKAERRNSKIVENVHAPSSGWPRFSQDLLSRQHFSLSSAAHERDVQTDRCSMRAEKISQDARSICPETKDRASLNMRSVIELITNDSRRLEFLYRDCVEYCLGENLKEYSYSITRSSYQ